MFLLHVIMYSLELIGLSSCPGVGYSALFLCVCAFFKLLLWWWFLVLVLVLLFSKGQKTCGLILFSFNGSISCRITCERSESARERRIPLCIKTINNKNNSCVARVRNSWQNFRLWPDRMSFRGFVTRRSRPSTIR